MSDRAIIERRPFGITSSDGTSRYTEPGSATCGQCGKLFRFEMAGIIVCPHCGMVYASFEFGSRVLQKEAGDETNNG